MRKILLAVAVVAFGTIPGLAAAVDWRGGTTGDWGVAANWTPTGVPGPADAVTIASGTVVAYSTDVLNVASLTLGAAGVTPVAVLQLSTGLAVGGVFQLSDGAALQTFSSASITAVDVTLLRGTSVALVAAPATAGTPPFLRLYASGTFNLSGGSTITVRGRGYSGGVGAAPGSGPGAGGAAGGNGAGGGAHGGAAGNGGAAVNGGSSNEIIFPIDGGSGGGGSATADG
ncbi:MAG: hypothetical protein HY923_05780, partial [Elusimicrobia bacterium]|nr:hypothetical protein [Elusimicrobiota bacterium]